MTATTETNQTYWIIGDHLPASLDLDEGNVFPDTPCNPYRLYDVESTRKQYVNSLGWLE